MLTDIRIRFISYFADFLDIGNVRWFQQPIPIVRCQEPFSLYIAAEFERARQDMDAAGAFTEQAEDALRSVMNREIQSEQRVNVKRQACGGGPRRRSVHAAPPLRRGRRSLRRHDPHQVRRVEEAIVLQSQSGAADSPFV